MAINIADLPVEIITQVGQIGLWLQALGIVVVIAVIFDVITFIINRKRMKEIGTIKKDMTRIERKIDSLLTRNQKR